MYLEIAVGSPRNRGLLIHKNNLYKYLSKNEPVYRSLYLYNDKQIIIKNYFGERDIDNIIIDIDKDDNSDEHTLNKVNIILNKLGKLGLPKTAYQVYFSGSGYHIKITNEAFGFKASKDLPYIVKETMINLLNPIKIDNSIYMRTGIYRIAHTINKKTNCYKIPLTRSEVKELDADYIIALAKEQRLDYKYSKLTANQELNKYIVTQAPRIKTFGQVTEPTRIATCIQRLLSKGANEGSRNVTSLRIISHLARNGLPSEYAKQMLLHWNNNSLEEQKIIENVEYVYNKGYRYGCHDKILRDNCSALCIYYKRKDYLVDVKTADDMQEALIKRMETDFSNRTIDLGKCLGIDGKYTIYPGELVTIFGPTGSNKTTLAQNLALGYNAKTNEIESNKQIKTLFLSLELADWYLHWRNLAIIADCEINEVERNYDILYKYHKAELSHISVQTISPTIEQIKSKVRDLRPHLVIVDYIDLIDTPSAYRGEYEKIKYISHSLSNLAVNEDIIILQLSQVNREYSREGILDLYAGKGSGAIENASRKVIGIAPIKDSILRKVELYKNNFGDLFQTVLEWQSSFRLRNYKCLPPKSSLEILLNESKIVLSKKPKKGNNGFQKE